MKVAEIGFRFANYEVRRIDPAVAEQVSILRHERLVFFPGRWLSVSLSLSLSRGMRVKRAARLVVGRKRISSAPRVHGKREEDRAAISFRGRESCSARRRPVSQYISGMHGAFHDKIFQY